MKNLLNPGRGAICFSTALFLIGIALNAGATTLTWTNTAGGLWSNPTNWSPNVVPGQLNTLNSADDVLITNAGTYKVVLDVGTSPAFWDIRSLTLGGGSGTQTLAMTNRILYVAPLTIANGGVLNNNGSSFHAGIVVENGGRLNSSNGVYYVSPFAFAGGSIFDSTNDQFHSPLVVSNGAAFTAAGGTIEGDGSMELGGTLNIPSGGFVLNGTATNSGTITINSGANLDVNSTLTLGGAGGVLNLPGGTVNFSNGHGISSDNGAEYFANQGTLNASGGFVQSVSHFTNSGDIYVSANTLNLDSGPHFESAGSLNVQLDNASSYGKIAISGAAALTGAFNVTLGAGYNPQNGDTFEPVTYSSFSGAFTSTNLPSLVPWQMTYSPSAVTLSVTTQTITWTNAAGGNWSDANNWNPNVVPGGSAYGNEDDVQITAPGAYTVVMDEGTVSSPYYVHSLMLGGGSGVQTLAITNKWLDAATMSVNSGGQVNSSGCHWFNNWVTPLMVASGGAFNSSTDLFDQDVTVNPGGMFSADDSTNGNGWFNIAGALDVPSGHFTLNGAMTNSGTITVENGGGIAVNDNLVLSAAGGITTLPGGTISIAGGHGISGDNGAEVLNNQGQINSSGGYIQSIVSFTNSGAINALGGTLNLDSGLQLQPSGSLNAQLNSAGDYGVIAISGNAALAGSFGVTLNYSPAAGDSFTPLTYSSHSGNFDNLDLPALGTGQSWQSSVGATALTLQIAETVTWTNTAGGNWSDAASWNPNKVPGQFDDVAVTTPGDYTVNVDASPNVKSLTLGAGGGAQTLAVVNKTLSANSMNIANGGILSDGSYSADSTYHVAINVQSGGQIFATNGTYDGPITIESGGQMTAGGGGSFVTFHSNVSVENGGTLTLVAPFGGQVSYDGTLAVDAGGSVNIPGGRLFLYGPMTNSGTVNLTGGVSSTDIRIENNGTAGYQGFLLNLPGGTINLNGNGGVIFADYGNAALVNQGAVVNAGGSSHSINVSDFDNSGGAVTNLAGTFGISTFSNTLAGTFYATNGATIELQGGTPSAPLKPDVPLLLTGPGSFEFIAGWLDLTNDIIPRLQMMGNSYGNNSFLELEPTFQGGAITNLALDGITLTNAPGTVWTVTNGTFAVTNSIVYGSFTAENGGRMIACQTYSPMPTFYGDVRVENGSSLTVSGAYIYSNVTVDAGGEFDNFDSGTWLQPGSSMTINSGGVLNSGYYFYDEAPMTNFGTINITNFGYPNDGYSFQIQNDGSRYFGGLLNGPGGTINFLPGAGANPGIVRYGGYNQEYVINQGTIVSSMTANIGVADFENSGTIANLGGTLTLGIFRNTLAGNFYTAVGATTRFYGGTAAAPLTPGPMALDGSGQYQFIANDNKNTYGWLDLTADNIPNLDLQSGVLELEPSFQAGAITNLTLDGIIFTNLNALPVAGTFNTTNSLLAGTIVVTNGGVWNATGGNIFGPVTIDSGGVLNDDNNIYIYPPGSVTVAQNGQVNLDGGYLNLYVPMTNSGTVNLPNDNQIYIYNNGSTYLGGILNDPDGEINLFSYGGILGTSYGQEYLLNRGGIVKSTYANGASIHVSNFTNSGAITSLEGTLSLNQVALLPSGSLNVRINSKIDYGKLAISGNAALSGTIGATLGGIYVPTNGTSFDVLSYGSYSGGFTASNLPPLVAWQTIYNPTKVTLLVIQTGLIPEFTTVAAADGNLIFSGTNGTAGNEYWVLTSTNVSAPLADWTSVATNNFDGIGRFSYTNTPDPSKPQQYFILQLQ